MTCRVSLLAGCNFFAGAPGSLLARTGNEHRVCDLTRHQHPQGPRAERAPENRVGGRRARKGRAQARLISAGTTTIWNSTREQWSLTRALPRSHTLPVPPQREVTKLVDSLNLRLLLVHPAGYLIPPSSSSCPLLFV